MSAPSACMNCSASIPIRFPRRFARLAAGCNSGGNGAVQGNVAQGAEYIPGLGTKRPNPFLSAGFFWLTEGNSSYNALEVDVTHRISKGLEFRGNYTWSKNLDINSGLTGAQANNQAQMVLEPQQSAQGLGPVGVESRQPGQRFGQLRTSLRPQPALAE